MLKQAISYFLENSKKKKIECEKMPFSIAFLFKPNENKVALYKIGPSPPPLIGACSWLAPSHSPQIKPVSS